MEYWEIINENSQGQSADITERLKVFGGWIVRSGEAYKNPGFVADQVGMSMSMCFVPDPNHEWQLGAL